MKLTGLRLLHQDFAELVGTSNNEFLFGLYEVSAVLRYWGDLRNGGHWMMFFMMNPAWRSEE